MKPLIEKKLSSLDPDFKEKIEKLFEYILESISTLHDEATIDIKTGLYNCRFFENVLEMEIDKVERYDNELSLIILDIDYFKKINDKYGHIVADELLERLAKIILKHTRKSDVAARFGGEEFTLLLTRTNLNQAKILVERLREDILKDKILSKYGLTVSGGIGQFEKGKDNRKRFLMKIDKALYKAKETGRNKIISVE